MQTKRKLIGLLAGLLAVCSIATAQPGEKFIKVNVAPRMLFLAEETKHWTYPEQWEKAMAWVFELMTGNQ